MVGSGEPRFSLKLKRRIASPPPAPEALPSAPPQERLRPPSLRHHWLTISVSHPGPTRSIPAPGARVVVRAYSDDRSRAGPPVARGVTRADGAVAFLLPPGRYFVVARDGGSARAATIEVDRPGHASLLLEEFGRRVELIIEAVHDDGQPLMDAAVDIRLDHNGAEVMTALTDEHGVATFDLRPGAYRIQVGEATARTFLDADTRLRIHGASPKPPTRLPTTYQLQARQAVNYVQEFELARLRDEGWN